MTDSDVKAEAWAPFHDAKYYQADALSGRVRSLDRTLKGRFYPETVLKPRPDGDGYLRINYRDDNGVRQEGASVARCVLMAHDPGGYFPGAEACHGDGGRQDNRLANLRWDTSEANREEALAVRLERNPPKPKPLKVCARCGAGHDRQGKNCLRCMVQIGADGTDLILSGMRPEKVEKELAYPFIGVFNLAVTHGGLRFYREGYPPSPPPKKRRSLSVLFRRGPSRRD